MLCVVVWYIANIIVFRLEHKVHAQALNVTTLHSDPEVHVYIAKAKREDESL